MGICFWVCFCAKKKKGRQTQYCSLLVFGQTSYKSQRLDVISDKKKWVCLHRRSLLTYPVRSLLLVLLWSGFFSHIVIVLCVIRVITAKGNTFMIVSHIVYIYSSSFGHYVLLLIYLNESHSSVTLSLLFILSSRDSFHCDWTYLSYWLLNCWEPDPNTWKVEKKAIYFEKTRRASFQGNPLFPSYKTMLQCWYPQICNRLTWRKKIYKTGMTSEKEKKKTPETRLTLSWCVCLTRLFFFYMLIGKSVWWHVYFCLSWWEIKKMGVSTTIATAQPFLEVYIALTWIQQGQCKACSLAHSLSLPPSAVSLFLRMMKLHSSHVVNMHVACKPLRLVLPITKATCHDITSCVPLK